MLTILTVFGSGLALFAVLTVAGWAYRWVWTHAALDQAESRLTELRASRPGTNGHNYGLTWPATRTRPWRRRVR